MSGVAEEVSIERDGFAMEFIRPACTVPGKNKVLVSEFKTRLWSLENKKCSFSCLVSSCLQSLHKAHSNTRIPHEGGYKNGQ